MLKPKAVWLGSANLTELADRHLEMATLSNDTKLMSDTLGFVAGAIRLSEPWPGIADDITPDLRNENIRSTRTG